MEDLMLGHRSMAIKIDIIPTTEKLVCKSHWWGFPDMPKAFAWPENEKGDMLTFICQIRLEDVAHLDREGRLPHRGMLWFFADLDYFLGDMDAPCAGTGEWEHTAFKVLYSEECDDLITHEYRWEDGTSAVLDVEAMSYSECEESAFGFKLLGVPAMTEGYENENEGLFSLLQLDEEERWGLRFFDCGTINFMLPIGHKRGDFLDVKLYLHSL